ncbi:MAG: DoxX family protein [Thalassobius sp.]|nr:DoxX family protein [Thalassovita sp.]|tara:strand:- start:175 stop:579 length:405 start_codon:yes stop_codon:yes gene_type:complete
MKKMFLSNNPLSSSVSIFILRLVAGGSMLSHGFPKLQKVLAGEFQFADPFGLGPEVSLFMAVFAEVICSVLLILGLFTRLALIPLIITMAVAFFLIHGSDDYKVKELAFIYLCMYLSIFFSGAGKISIDQMINK